MKLNKFILVILISLPGLLYAQKHDKTVTEHGKKFYLHIVTKGETVYGLSKDYNVAVRDIVMENPKAMEGINPGDTLRIPFPVVKKKQADTTSSGKYTYHMVAPKETLYSLAREYKVKITTLDSLNPGLANKGLKAGQLLRIPATANQTPAQPAPQPQAGEHVITHETAPVTNAAKEKNAFKNFVNEQKKPADTTKVKTVTPPPSIIPPAPVQAVADTTPVQPGQLLSRYNVALIMPFTSEDADTMNMARLLDGSEQIPLYTHIATDFYQGVLTAVDSLEKQGLKVNLHLYNINSSADTNTLKFDSILSLPNMAMMNLIIGPPSTAHFKKAEVFAAQHNIPIVSPIVGDNNILQNNAFTSKATPSSATEIKKMADFIASHYTKSNVILIHHRDAANDSYYDDFKTYFNSIIAMHPGADSVVTVTYSDDLKGLGKKIADTRNNVVVVPYQGASFVAKLLNKLANSDYADNDSIVLFGMHDWVNNDALDMDNLDTLNFHFPSNDYVNYSDSCTKGFISRYRSNYYTEPDYYAYQGFDIAYYYMGLLNKYGTGMQDHLGDATYTGAHTSFKFQRVNAAGGYDNEATYILEYKNYTLIKDKF